MMDCCSLKSPSCLLATKIVFCLVAIYFSVGGPNGIAHELQNCQVGQNVTLLCRTNMDADVDWMYKSDPALSESYVYSNGVIYESYRSRFTIERPTNVDYNLVIVDVRLSDSGSYFCVEDGGLGTTHHVKLIVSGGPSEVASTAAMTVHTEPTVSALSTVAIVVIVLVIVIALSTLAFVFVFLLGSTLRRKRDSSNEALTEHEKKLLSNKTKALQQPGDSKLIHSQVAVHQSTDIASETEITADPATNQITTKCHGVLDIDGNNATDRKQATVDDVVANMETLCVDKGELGDGSEHATDVDDSNVHRSAASGRQSRQMSPVTRKRSNTEGSGVDVDRQANVDQSDNTSEETSTDQSHNKLKPLPYDYVMNRKVTIEEGCA